MIVSENTTQINFTLRNDTFVGETANVTFKNETSGEVVINDDFIVHQQSYYYQILNGVTPFAFVDGHNYIMEVKFNGVLEYRATLYCMNDLQKVYNNQKRLHTGNTYITI